MIKTIIAAMCACAVGIAAAAAETFAFQSTNGDETVVGGKGADGVAFSGAYWTGSGVSTNQKEKCQIHV